MTDYSKRFQPRTRGGYEYEIFAERDGRLWGRYRLGPESGWAWESGDWLANGKSHETSFNNPFDLLPIAPEKAEGWVELPFLKKGNANWVWMYPSSTGREPCRRITYTPGTPKTDVESFEIARTAVGAGKGLHHVIKTYMEAYSIGRVIDSTPEGEGV